MVGSVDLLGYCTTELSQSQFHLNCKKKSMLYINEHQITKLKTAIYKCSRNECNGNPCQKCQIPNFRKNRQIFLHLLYARILRLYARIFFTHS